MSGNIYGAINSVMAELGAIGKDKRNAQQNFNYRGVDDVMNALNPLLVKHKLFCVPEVIEQTREERKTAKGGSLVYSILTMRYTLVAEDGSSISAVVIGEGMDSGDKASNKAMSVAYKYAMFQIFSIPTEEMKDPDAESYEAYTPPAQSRKEDQLAERKAPLCVLCHNPIKGIGKDGALLKSADEVLNFTTKETGAALCYGCYKQWKAENG